MVNRLYNVPSVAVCVEQKWRQIWQEVVVLWCRWSNEQDRSTSEKLRSLFFWKRHFFDSDEKKRAFVFFLVCRCCSSQEVAKLTPSKLQRKMYRDFVKTWASSQGLLAQVFAQPTAAVNNIAK